MGANLCERLCRSNYFIMLNLSSIFISATEKTLFSEYLVYLKSLQPRGEWDYSRLTCSPILMMHTMYDFHMLMCTCLNLKPKCWYTGKQIINYESRLCKNSRQGFYHDMNSQHLLCQSVNFSLTLSEARQRHLNHKIHLIPSVMTITPGEW